MKLLVFAHVPPPHHGQSAMVKLMVERLPEFACADIQVLHVDARLSDTIDDVGQGRLIKLLRLLRFAFQAIRLRFTQGVRDFYYVPAPPKPSAMLRDWVVMLLCRPFFPRIYLHWHAVGLGDWSVKATQSEAISTRLAGWLNLRLLGGHHRSLVLTTWGRKDIEPFCPRSVEIVPNGITDPCPDFASELSSRRVRRVEQLRSGDFEMFRVAFLGHCTGEKGLWDAMEAVALAASKGHRIMLRIAGEFPSDEDRSHFHQLRDKLANNHGIDPRLIEHVGFVGGEAKRNFISNSDVLCFPTKYHAESFGLVAVEAMAFGIPTVATDWRMVPGIMALADLPVSAVGKPESIANGLIAAIGRDDPRTLRAVFLEHFTEQAHLQALANGLATDASASAP